jgi:hypothetical protein
MRPNIPTQRNGNATDENGRPPASRRARCRRAVLFITAAYVGMNARKPNLFKIKIARVIPFVQFRGRRLPADTRKILAIFIDRYCVFCIADIYVERGVVEALLQFGEVDCLKPFPKVVTGQRRSPFEIGLQRNQCGANDHQRRDHRKDGPNSRSRIVARPPSRVAGSTTSLGTGKYQQCAAGFESIG